MKDWRIVWALAVSMLAPVPAACIRDADLIIQHAKIYTSNKSIYSASAPAVKDRLIMKIGTDRVVLALKGTMTRVIDARGKVLVPGFVDNHAHPLFVGTFQKATVDIFELKTKQEVIQNLAAFLQEHTEIPQLIGFSWHYQSPITVSGLDAVSREIPIVIWAYDAEGDSANSLTLQLLLKDPGEYRKLGGQYDEQGRPTGQFIYFHQFNPLKSFKPWFVAQRRWEKVMELALVGMDAKLTEALRNGVTTMKDVQIYPEMMPWKTMAEVGIPISFGSDRCISNPWSPFAGILVANRRIFYDLFTNPGKHNAISVEDALYYYTYGSAEALCMEDMVGSLAVGKRADMVILTVDGLDDLVSLWTIMRTFFDYDYGLNFVEKTFVDGVAVFERE